jgi:molybdate transport system substrate-binding protein
MTAWRMNSLRVLAWLAVATLSFIVACQGSSSTLNTSEGGITRLTVAAAADLRFALGELEPAFEAAQRGVELDIVYGSSGKLFAQIQNGAPFDVYLSADASYPERLVSAGLAERGDRFDYAIGRLSMWVLTRSTLDITARGLAALVDGDVRKIAIANPAHAPYGKAAVQALQRRGLLAQVKERLVYGENVSQAAQYVEAGAADVGLIALSLALSPNMRKSGRHVLVPAEAHDELRQGGVVLRRAGNRATGQAFARFMVLPNTRGVLKRYGFGMPHESEAREGDR